MQYSNEIYNWSGFVALNFNPENFLEKDIPSLHPLSSEYVEYWREQKKRCIEGYWHQGVWMPGKLYFYVNFGTIKRNIEGSNVKFFARPALRDLEWMFFYNWEEARGLSGFEYETEYSSHRALIETTLNNEGQLVLISDEEIIDKYCKDKNKLIQSRYDNIFKKDGTRKTYMGIREYLRTPQSFDKGCPLYFNDSKNIMMLGSRGFGKSYSLGVGIVLHEWLFDGLNKYEPGKKLLSSAEVIVGAADAKYSRDVLDKTRTALERLPGEFETSGKKVFPAPFKKQYTGSWTPAKKIVAEYKAKVGGNWIWKGTKSTIKHLTFKDNAFAAQGTRPGVMLFEEVGMFMNLLESYNASVECQRDGDRKFGTMAFIGTGGDFEGGGTRDAYEMFYNPDKYDIISFEDVWENKPKIGYFVPAYMGLNDCKDEKGLTDIHKALKKLEATRLKLRNQGGNSSALNNEIQYRPLKPSEIFLSRTGNIFPIAELKERLDTLLYDAQASYLEKKVSLFFDSHEKYNVNYKIDINNSLKAVNTFPYDDKNREGCVVIYEFPERDKDGNIPRDLYVIGHDPYANDDPSGESLATIYVMKTKKHAIHYGSDEIVAVYCGRPFEGREIVNEILLKLSMFYGNAKIYFENAVGNVKEYFEKMKMLHLLAKRPQTVLNKKSKNSSAPSREYGYPMSNRVIKLEGIQYIRDWLLEPIKETEDKISRNLDRIWDIGLLQELIAFNLDDNFDRVMGFMGCVIGANEMYNQYEEKIREASKEQVSDIDFLLGQSWEDRANYSSQNLRSLRIDYSKF